MNWGLGQAAAHDTVLLVLGKGLGDFKRPGLYHIWGPSILSMSYQLLQNWFLFKWIVHTIINQQPVQNEGNPGVFDKASICCLLNQDGQAQCDKMDSSQTCRTHTGYGSTCLAA